MALFYQDYHLVIQWNTSTIVGVITMLMGGA
jgi:hypothetical protein